jgi:tetratricopeptide (TPR) repeat protein
MMNPALTRLSALCASGLLLSCAQVAPRAVVATGVGAAAPAAGADSAYLAGRQLHLAQLLPQALAAYEAALRVDPGHVNARNALAALHAEQGDYARAIALWRGLTEQAIAGPDTAYLFSNLGYAYLLSGDYPHALAQLEKACMLDPLNHRAWQHLGGTLERLGQGERAQLMYRQAQTLQAHDFKADYAAAQRAGVAAAIDSAVSASPRTDAQFPAIELRQGASGIYELHRIGALPAQQLRAPAEIAALLEIRNGNGVTGMARELARTMGDASLRVVRVTNQKGYGVQRTRVEYQPAFRDAASRLAERLGAGADATLAVDSVAPANVRLVIGRDLVAQRSAIAQVQARPARAGQGGASPVAAGAP